MCQPGIMIIIMQEDTSAALGNPKKLTGEGTVKHLLESRADHASSATWNLYRMCMLLVTPLTCAVSECSFRQGAAGVGQRGRVHHHHSCFVYDCALWGKHLLHWACRARHTDEALPVCCPIQLQTRLGESDHL